MPQGRAVKGVPILRTNLSELQDPDHAHEDTALIQAITDPPAFYAPNLDRHNAYRAQHTSTPPLAWDDAVADSAAVYASRCIWGHDQNNKYGVSCLTRVRQSDSQMHAVLERRPPICAVEITPGLCSAARTLLLQENLYAYAYSLDNDKAAFQMAGVKAWCAQLLQHKPVHAVKTDPISTATVAKHFMQHAAHGAALARSPACL